MAARLKRVVLAETEAKTEQVQLEGAEALRPGQGLPKLVDLVAEEHGVLDRGAGFDGFPAGGGMEEVTAMGLQVGRLLCSSAMRDCSRLALQLGVVEYL